MSMLAAVADLAHYRISGKRVLPRPAKETGEPLSFAPRVHLSRSDIFISPLIISQNPSLFPPALLRRAFDEKQERKREKRNKKNATRHVPLLHTRGYCSLLLSLYSTLLARALFNRVVASLSAFNDDFALFPQQSYEYLSNFTHWLRIVSSCLAS